MSDANVIPGPWAPRETADAVLFGNVQLRPSFRDLAKLAGSFGDALDIALDHDRKSSDAAEVIALSEHLDEIARRARLLGYRLNKSAFLVIAQDAESLSERLVHLAAGEAP